MSPPTLSFAFGPMAIGEGVSLLGAGNGNSGYIGSLVASQNTC